jgi:hypothetical protein
VVRLPVTDIDSGWQAARLDIVERRLAGKAHRMGMDMPVDKRIVQDIAKEDAARPALQNSDPDIVVGNLVVDSLVVNILAADKLAVGRPVANILVADNFAAGSLVVNILVADKTVASSHLALALAHIPLDTAMQDQVAADYYLLDHTADRHYLLD